MRPTVGLLLLLLLYVLADWPVIEDLQWSRNFWLEECKSCLLAKEPERERIQLKQHKEYLLYV